MNQNETTEFKDVPVHNLALADHTGDVVAEGANFRQFSHLTRLGGGVIISYDTINMDVQVEVHYTNGEVTYHYPEDTVSVVV